MSSLYTKNGRPLQVSGDNVYSRSGKHVGRISGDTIYGLTGRYAATIVGDRAVYRSADSASTAGVASPRASRVGTAEASRVGSAIMGSEPEFPD